MGYDYKEKMSQNRSEWAKIGIYNTSMNIPQKFGDYFKALAIITTAEHLMEQIDAKDEDVLDAFANRQPRVNVSIADLELIKESVSSELLEDVVDLIRVLRSKKEANASAKQAAAEGDAIRTAYFFAREYAIAYYIRGAFAMLTLKIEGRVPRFEV